MNSEKLILEKNKSTVNSSILQNENNLITLQNKLKTVEENIDTFYKNKDIIENNTKLLVEIEGVKSNIKTIESQIKTINNSLFSASTQKGTLDFQYQNTTEKLNKVKELETQYESYKLYTNIISRDGIPYEIITKTLPEIEKEVDNILHETGRVS